jgi:hypothetical protein
MPASEPGLVLFRAVRFAVISGYPLCGLAHEPFGEMVVTVHNIYDFFERPSLVHIEARDSGPMFVPLIHRALEVSHALRHFGPLGCRVVSLKREIK